MAREPSPGRLERRRARTAATLALAFCCVFEAAPSACAGQRPRVGLALSGGGARGLAHIGVLKVVEEAGLSVDVVSGTSMGSVVGALYAIGYSPAEIERIALEADWSDLFSDRLRRDELTMKNRKRDDRYLVSFPVIRGRVRLPAGLVGGQKVYDLLARLAWPVLEIDDFGGFPRPFSCVATDIATGEVVVFTRGYLPDALRASMAIPSVFTPVRIGGRLLVDGGLARNLPAEDAKALGADVVIGVDVTPELAPADELESLVDILNQSFDLAQKPGHATQRALCSLVIVPGLEGIRSIDYHRAAEIILAGEEAARGRFEALRSLADSIAAASAGRAPSSPEGESSAPGGPGGAGGDVGLAARAPMRVDEIEVRGLRDVSERFVLAELGVQPPRAVTADELERAVRRLYSSGYFAEMRYHFEAGPKGRKLVLLVTETSDVVLNTGLRYDTHWRTSLLLNATVRNLLEHGSQLEFDVLLGDRRRIEAEYALHTGIRRSVGVRIDADWLDDHIDEYRDGERVSRWGVSSVRSGLLLETLLSRVLYAAAGLNAEWFEISPDIAPEDAAAERERLVFLSGDLWIDTLDRLWFTRRGVMLRLRGEAASSGLGSDRSFERAYAHGCIAVPIHGLVTVRTDLFAGFTGGEAPPLHYRFFIGGENSCAVFQGNRTSAFHGYRHQELAGRYAFAAAVDLQVEPFRGWYVTLGGNAGTAVEERGDLFRSARIRSGGALGLGVETPAGPLEILVSYGGGDDLGLFLDAGFPF